VFFSSIQKLRYGIYFLFAHHIKYSDDQVKEYKMGWSIGFMREKKYACRILVGKPEVKEIWKIYV